MHVYRTNIGKMNNKKTNFYRVCAYIENYHHLDVQDILYYIYFRILQGSIGIAYFYYIVIQLVILELQYLKTVYLLPNN